MCLKVIMDYDISIVFYQYLRHMGGIVVQIKIAIVYIKRFVF